jgi:nitrite reductase/ring-hydroxylating ferredoxin subunit
MARPGTNGYVSARVRVGELKSIVGRGGVAVVADGSGRSTLVVATADGDVFAVANTCPHQGTELVAGYVSSTNGEVWIECPLHSWRFDLATGHYLIRGEKSRDPQDRLATAACVVDEAGVVWLEGDVL